MQGKFCYWVFLGVLALSGCQPDSPEEGPVRIIFDTDFGPDYDDVGALAFLHAMADSGKAEILATLSCNRHALVGPGIDVLNTYFGRPDIPIGAPGPAAVNMGASQYWLDTLVAKYPHDVTSTADLPDAVNVYRRVLQAQPDNSVTVITVGFLTNLADLLRSPPDSISPLNGQELVAGKVNKLVSMAGSFPEGREFNVHMDAAASQYVFEHWPTPVIFTGFEIGWEIRTGLRVMHMPVTNNPVKDVFRICIPLSAEDRNGRMSWDETAVLIGIYGTAGFFTVVPGTITVQPDGSNGWTGGEGRHAHVVQEMPVDQMSRFIEDRMMHIPTHK